MATVPEDYQLTGDQRPDPMVWCRMAPADALDLIATMDTSDEAMHRYLGPGRAMRLKSFGHDDDGVHFLLTRKGTTVHTDKAYTRYSHQIILRNDGNRLRGLPRYDSPDPDRWHPMLTPGMMYCLDTHSPHQGLADTRFPDRGTGMKAVIAVDRDRIMTPDQTWALLAPWLGRQFGEVEFDPSRVISPRTNKAAAAS